MHNNKSCIVPYSQTAVGLFNSEVQTHLVILANRGSDDYGQLKDKLGALAPEFTGKVRAITQRQEQNTLLQTPVF